MMKRKQYSQSRRCEYCSPNTTQFRTEEERRCCCLNRTFACHSASTYRKKDMPNNSLLTVQSREFTSSQHQDSPKLQQLISDNTLLRAENSRLRRDIDRILLREQTKKPQKQEQSFLSQPQILPIPTSLPSSNSNETLLQDKLYQSNKNLQQTIINLNLASKVNKDLEEKLSQLRISCDQLRLQRDSLQQQLEKYKSRLKKSISMLKQQNNSSTITMHQNQSSTCNTLHSTNPDSLMLLDKYTELVKANMHLKNRNEQIIEENDNLRNALLLYQNSCSSTSTVNQKSNTANSNWARKTAKKINSIQQNISKIEENHNQITEAKERLEELQQVMRDRMGIVYNCHDYIHQQMTLCAKSISSAIPKSINNNVLSDLRTSERLGLEHQQIGSLFKQLSRVSHVFSNSTEYPDMIAKMDISLPLSSILISLTQYFIVSYQHFMGQFQNHMKNLQGKLKVLERKANTTSKMATNFKLKSKTERTRMRHLSSKSNVDSNSYNNKENLSSLSNMDRWNSNMLTKENGGHFGGGNRLEGGGYVR